MRKMLKVKTFFTLKLKKIKRPTYFWSALKYGGRQQGWLNRSGVN